MAKELKVGLKITADGKQAEGELGRVGEGLDQVGKEAKQAASDTDLLSTGLKAVAAALSADYLLGKAADLAAVADQYNNMAGRLKLVAGEGAALAEALEAVRVTANTSGADLDATATLYTRLAQASKELGLSQAELIGLTETINKTFAISGASTAEAASSIRQLGQALASGVLRGDEFNSVMENSPRLAQALADGLDVPIGALRKMAEEGELTAERVTRALQSQTAAIEADFSKMPDTVSRATQRLSNEWTVFIGKLDQTSGATTAISSGLNSLAENLDEIAAAALYFGEVATAAIAGKAALAMRAYAVEAIAATGATTAMGAAASGLAGILGKIGPLLKSVGYAAIAVEVFDLARGLIELRGEYEKHAEIVQRTAEANDKVRAKLAEISQQAGVTITSMAALDKAVDEGRIHFDQATGSWQRGAQDLSKVGETAKLTKAELDALAETAEKNAQRLAKSLAAFGLEDLQQKLIEQFRELASNPETNGSQILSGLLLTLDKISKERVPEVMLALRQAFDRKQIGLDEFETGVASAETKMQGLWTGIVDGSTQAKLAVVDITDQVKKLADEREKAAAAADKERRAAIEAAAANTAAMESAAIAASQARTSIGGMQDSINGFRQHIQELGGAMAGVINQARQDMFNLSDAALAMYQSMDFGNAGETIGMFLEDVSRNTAYVRTLFEQQTVAMEALQARIASGTMTTDELDAATAQLAGTFSVLGTERLDGLRDSIADARQRMLDLRDAAQSTLDGIQDEWDQLNNNLDEIERRRASKREAEIAAQLAAAKSSGDREAIADLEKALRLLKQVTAARIEDAKQREKDGKWSGRGDSGGTNTSGNRGGSSNGGISAAPVRYGDTHIHIEGVLDINDKATLDSLGRKLDPVLKKITRLGA
jgi:tape measure domain-containing protein